MSILSAIKQQNSTLDDLAALPQAMIMQMAQKKQISQEMLAPILARKAELADAFARQNAMQGAAQAQPTVMEQLMAQNAQAEQPQIPQAISPQMPQPMAQAMPQGAEDVGIATQATAPMNLAGGGIIAFAGGDLVDEEDDTEDAREESDYAAMMNAALSGIKGIPNKLAEFASRLPKSYEATKSAASQGKEDSFISKIEHLESRGKDFDKNGNILTSAKGAKGRMQVMDKTNLDPGFGVKPAQDNSPEERARVGRDYALALKNYYNGNEKLAAMAYNWGPGNVNKLLASDGKVSIPRETQKYASNFVNGGEVRHFANQGYVGFGEEAPYDPNEPSIYDTFGTMIGSPMERLKSSIYGVGPTTAKERAEQQKKPTKSTKSSQADVRKSDQKIESSAPSPDVVVDPNLTVRPIQQGQSPTQAIPKSGLESFMEQMIAQKSELAKQRQEDKNMALLTAGLGMLGGTSQYAFENIGKGALAGVQNLGEARKARAAEQNAIDKNMLYAHRYQGVENVAKQNAAATQALRQREYELDVAKHGTEQQKIAINQYETHINNAIKSLDKNPILAADPVARAAAEDKILRGDTARALYRRAYGDMGLEQPTVSYTPKQQSLLSKYLNR